MSHPIPSDMEAAKAFSCSRVALDLFIWLSYRCFVAKGCERVPLFGDFGLVNQLGSSDYARPRKFRERLEGWLDLVRAMWPECPAVMDTTGTGIWRLSLEHIEATVADHLGNGSNRAQTVLSNAITRPARVGPTAQAKLFDAVECRRCR